MRMKSLSMKKHCSIRLRSLEDFCHGGPFFAGALVRNDKLDANLIYVSADARQILMFVGE